MPRSQCMKKFLICENPKCRLVIDLREGGRVLKRSHLVLNECHERGQYW